MLSLLSEGGAMTKFRKARLAIVLDGVGAEAALVATSRQGAELVDSCKVDGSAVCLEPFDLDAVSSLFNAVAERLPPAARRADVECILCLPEPLVHEDILEFEAFPDNPQEAAALICHRIGRENWMGDQGLVSSHAVISGAQGGGEGKGEPIVVRARWMLRSLRDGLEAAATRAGFYPTRIEGWSGFLELAPAMQPPSDRALVWSDGQSWVLLCQSTLAGDLLDSGWIAGSAAQTEEIADQIIRRVRTYMHRHAIASLPFVIEAPDEMFAVIRERVEAAGFAASAEVLDGRFLTGALRVAAWR